MKRTLQRLKRALVGGPHLRAVERSFREPCPRPLDSAIFNFTVDLELFWSNGRAGDQDLPAPMRVQAAMKQRQNFDAFMELLDDLRFPISWAIAGRLAAPDLEPAPGKRFAPKWATQSWYEAPTGVPSEAVRGEDLIRKILAAGKRHEILSHGFAHIDYSDESTSRDIAEEDLRLSKQAIDRHGVRAKGFVFPCNRLAYLDLLPREGFGIARGSDPRWHLNPGRPILTPIGFWISPGAMSAGELRKLFHEAIRRKAFIHPWMHLTECDFRQNDIARFYRPLFEHVLEEQARGRLRVMHFEEILDVLATVPSSR